MSELENLRLRLESLEAVEAIKRLKARYLNACDQQNSEDVRDCFAEGEIVIDMDYFGLCTDRDDFVDGIFIPRGCHDYVLDMHHCTNPEITITDEDHATGIWSLNYRNINTNDKTITLLSALYHDEYIKTEAGWKILKSRTEYKTVIHCDYDPGTLVINTAARKLS